MTMDARRIEIVSPESDAHAVTFADENQVIGGYANGEIRRWKIEDGQQQGPTMEAGGLIESIVVSQDGRWMVSGDRGGKAIVWNAPTHAKVRELTEHGHMVMGVDNPSDCTKFASAGHYDARMFSITSGERLLRPLRPHGGTIGLKFSPDGSRLAIASHCYGFCVYGTHNGNILFDSDGQGSTGAWPVTPLAWSSDGQRLFIASIGKITCLDLSKLSSSEWSIHENQSGVSIIGSIISHTSQVKCVALSPSGGYLACGNGRNITIHILGDVLSFKYVDHGLPLVRVSNETLESWIQDDPAKTETLLSEEVTSSSIPRHYVLANRALIRARLKHLASAIEDAEESLQVQPSSIGYVAMAIALLGQGDREGALCTFALAFYDCELRDNRFLLLLKFILVFESGYQDEAITRVEHLVTRANKDDDNDATYLFTQASALRCTLVLGVMYMKGGNYRRAIPLIERAKILAPKDKECPLLVTISLIFGWSFNGLNLATQQRLCENLYAEEHTAEAVEILLNIIKSSGKEIQANKATADWDFTKKCTATLEYSTALSLSPSSPVGLFIKRSRARAAQGLWEDALQDANEAVKVDPSSPWGYEAKHVALHGAKRYDEAIDAFRSMLQVIEQSHDATIRELRKNYISPSETIAAIDTVTGEILMNCPLVVIDADPSFKELVSSMTTEMDNERILRVVSSFFGYVMFSHVWQGNEPSFQDVNKVESKSVWNLPKTPLNEKLCNFCKETRRLGYNWAWSDTCCIDKFTSSVLNQSLTSMYKWYADSAATLVFLAHIPHPSKPGDLARSRWMTRAWTLQELLSPKVIFFYDSEWKPYLGNTSANHKESSEIMQELADAIKVSRGTIVSFSPGDLGVREKLCLASMRNATVEEDVAYSLIGIFESDIRPHCGERSDALGHLLEEIVARTGEVTVLAWSGKSSSYNSCLPASISVYSQTPYKSPSLEGGEMETCITELRGKLPQQEALKIYHQITFLPPAQDLVYSGYAQVMRSYAVPGYPSLGNVEFTTADDLPLHEPQKLVFVHPWIDHIRGPSSGVTWEDDPESDINSDPGSDRGAGLDGVAPPSPLHAVPMPQVDDYTRALQMITRIGQPFNALLPVQQSNGTYKRVAAENEIVVPGLGTNIPSSKYIQAKVLEIL
ncbi:hypothetical protein F5J12DRAFT_915856 [Pisolithus orientalis]|uniref:uncharacterized protein n=1 Tax=Pisolithus orientalis TaxID=936130 RepID=UPI002224FB6F|nr:uncharacterized protein F5J12DRAFT_915856 [Pisolithus orientalis]KAI5989190.1 hypothetical protein F5J12DRAFT_915856 [Pisolithus orientalis]